MSRHVCKVCPRCGRCITHGFCTYGKAGDLPNVKMPPLGCVDERKQDVSSTCYLRR